MMEIYIIVPEDIYQKCQNHLLPSKIVDEEALFLFADVKEENGKVEFTFQDYLVPNDSDFDFKSAWHIELSDGFRARLIKKAHELNASIIEFHSHVNQKKAEFSGSDRTGFSEFIPHIFWRLKNRPYAAVVVTKGSFDALVWVGDSKKPYSLTGLQIGNNVLRPTNLSIKKYKR